MDSDISPCGTSGKLVVSQIYVDCNWSDQLCPFRSMVKLGLALASSICQILQPYPPSVWELDIQEKDSLSCRYNQMSRKPCNVPKWIRVCISLAIPNSISIWTCTCTYQYVLYVQVIVLWCCIWYVHNISDISKNRFYLFQQENVTKGHPIEPRVENRSRRDLRPTGPRWTSYSQMSSRGHVGKRMQKTWFQPKKKWDVSLNRGRIKLTKLLLLKARDIWPGRSPVFACAGFKLWCNCGCFMQPFAIFGRFGEPSKYQRLLNVLAAGHSGSRKT